MKIKMPLDSGILLYPWNLHSNLLYSMHSFSFIIRCAALILSWLARSHKNKYRKQNMSIWVTSCVGFMHQIKKVVRRMWTLLQMLKNCNSLYTNRCEFIVESRCLCRNTVESISALQTFPWSWQIQINSYRTKRYPWGSTWHCTIHGGLANR